MSATLYPIFGCTSPAYEDDQGSLLCSMEQMHTYLLIPLRPGEGQNFLDKAIIKESHYFPS